MQLNCKVIKKWLPPSSTSIPPFQGYINPRFSPTPNFGGFQLCNYTHRFVLDRQKADDEFLYTRLMVVFKLCQITILPLL